MATWDLRERIAETYEVLEEDPRVEVLTARRNPPITQDEVDALNAELGWTLDPRFVEVFRTHDGFELVWVDATHGPEREGMEPWERYNHAVNEAPLGSIRIPSLAEVVRGLGEYDQDPGDEGRFHEEILGGWDSARLRRTMSTFNDFMDDRDFGSYELPGVVLDPIYPHPPLLIASDYMATFDGATPMLAADVVDLAVATLGNWEMWSKRSNGREPMFVPRDGWLDDLPTPCQMLDAVFDMASDRVTRRIERLLTEPGKDVARTPWASYVDPSLDPPTKHLEEPMDPVCVISKTQLKWSPKDDPGRQRIVDAIPSNRPLLIPTADPIHYRVDNPMRGGYFPAGTLRRLIGAMVKYRSRIYRSDEIACLVGVDADRVWLFQASVYEDSKGEMRFGSYGLNSTKLSDLEWIGLALPEI